MYVNIVYIYIKLLYVYVNVDYVYGSLQPISRRDFLGTFSWYVVGQTEPDLTQAVSVIFIILGITRSLKGGEARAYGGDCKDAPSSVVTFTL